GAIGYALYVIGFEYYNFATREIIASDSARWLGMIKDQFALYVGLYLLFLPVALILFVKDWLPRSYAIWFFGLLLLEHLAQELFRVLIAISEQILASVVLFLRSGAWCLVVVPIMLLAPETRTVGFVLGGWSVGALIACAVGAFRLLKLERGTMV